MKTNHTIRKRIYALLALAVTAGVISIGATGVKTYAATTSTTTKVVASEDTYATRLSPDTPHGAINIIRVDGSPKRIGYLKFHIPKIDTTKNKITKVQLKLYAHGKTYGYTVYGTGDNWSEKTLTYNNRPALGNKIGGHDTSAAGWSAVTITSYVHSGDTTSLALVAKTDLQTEYSSTEASSNKPNLLITTQPITTDGGSTGGSTGGTGGGTGGTGGGSTGGSTDPSTIPDSQPPTSPTSLAISSNSGGKIGLSWLASTDNVDVVGYNVYRDGGYIGSTNAATLHYTDTNTNPLSVYTVRAYDFMGNTSDLSNSTTPSQPDAPTVPANVKATVLSSTSVKLTWDEAAANGLAHFNIIRNSKVVASVPATSATTSYTYTDTSLTAGTSYGYGITAVNTNGGESLPSATVTVKTSGTASGDTQAPSVPAGVSATAPTYSQVVVTWSASTDNVGVTGYDVLRNGTQVAQVGIASRSFTDSTVAPSTKYSYAVKAFDGAGNTSAASTAASVTTPAQTTTGGGGGSLGYCGQTASAPSKYSHVVVIMMENKTYSNVIGNSAAPYISNLAAQCGTSTNYSDAGSQYNSLSNYIALTSGVDSCTTGSCASTAFNDCSPSSSCQAPVDNIFRQVRSIGGTAKSFEESMPSNCTLSNSGNYAAKHNPAAYFTGGSDRQACASDDLPMGTTSSGNLKNALASDSSMPTFSLLTPNMCDDMHDCAVSSGDKWISTWMPIILSSPAYTSGHTAVFLLWDEDTHIPNVFIAPSIKAGTKSSTAISHYSTLRTWEEMLGISSHLGKASTATSERSIFNF